MRVQPPTIDQFPTFNQVRSWLEYDTRECIWYLPNKGRCCWIKISENHSNIAYGLMIRLLGASEKHFPSMGNALDLLQQIAEHSCCVLKHRNKFTGSGLAQKLAIQWLTEMLVCEYGANSWHVQRLRRRVIARQSRPIANTVKFVQHEVFEYQTLASSLCTPLNSQEGKDGMIYIYTHKQDPFSGMLKIGYTCSRIQTRLDYWAECGHGYPTLLWSHTGVRHPRRVELLTHFELLDFWHEQQYCSIHNSPHVEWFKTDVEIARTIISDWSSWMESNPYDRRGNLKPFWEDTIDFLELYDIPLTAKTMLQIHQLELGKLRVSDFMDDEFCDPFLGFKSEETSSAVTNPSICNPFLEFRSEEASKVVIDETIYNPFLGWQKEA